MRFLWCTYLCFPSWFDPDMNVYDVWHDLGCLPPPWLFAVRPNPFFWSLKSDSIIMLEILPYDLHLDTRVTTHKPPKPALWLNSSSPALIWNARHVCPIMLTLHITMILHWHERDPIKSVHWACKYDVYFIISDLYTSSLDTGSERYKVRENFL